MIDNIKEYIQCKYYQNKLISEFEICKEVVANIRKIQMKYTIPSKIRLNLFIIVH